jgi:hypothetical protein
MTTNRGIGVATTPSPGCLLMPSAVAIPPGCDGPQPPARDVGPVRGHIKALRLCHRGAASREHLDPVHAEWLGRAAESASRRLRSGGADIGMMHDQAGIR